MTAPLDAATVKARASGRWPSILPRLAPSLVDALARAPRHGPCPRHGGKDGFRFFADVAETGGALCNTCGTFADGFSLLEWANGLTFPEVLAAVAEALGMAPGGTGAPRRAVPPAPPTARPPSPENAQEEAERRRAILRRVWSESQPLRAGDPADTYLKCRGLDFLARWPAVLRCHPGLPYFDGREVRGRFPCLVALVQGPAGRPVSLHRTYLRSDGAGKAPVPAPKKLLSPVEPGATRGGAVRLFRPGGALALAEGIETALAIYEASGIPVWATVSAGGMRAVELPPVVRVS